ncbi:transglutaminase-like domain-containing protein [Microbulbifer pacificus]|uniref:transglutaminase-like domain-containing protein n=1 Tax=Microbulbifer pacificus TaxID=407164 RepID=UPI000CF36A9C|nr:transglutaminase-like domain-containing protein [Microbulbifer pacificus]
MIRNIGILLFGIFLAGNLPAETVGSGQKVTLIAEIQIVNKSNLPISGYVHRISIPVNGHWQQELLQIRHDPVKSAIRKPFKDTAGEFLEIVWDIPANAQSVRKVYFELLLRDFHYPSQTTEWSEHLRQSEPQESYLQPAKYIEADSVEIRRLAQQIERSYSSSEGRLRAAYLLPQQIIQYRPQPNRGALYAVSVRQGDCTEFSALFVALARAMGYPARMTSEFHFRERRSFDRPNHHAAEVYLNERWIPVDPNLALDPSSGYGFGYGGRTKVVLNRNSVWVWSNRWPKGFNKKNQVEVDVQWHIE